MRQSKKLVVDNSSDATYHRLHFNTMTTSSSPSAAITPLAEQSTLEEDYFADLLLDDDPDEVVLPKSRENRMNRAFQDSKTIYRKSDALTEPGVSSNANCCQSQSSGGS